MMQYVLAKIGELMQAARDNYGVNPVVFVVIYVAAGPVFYYSLFRMIRALAKRLTKEIVLWSSIFMGTVVAPFLYVLLFGRNLPWWVYGIIALLLGQGVYSLVAKLRGKPAAREGEGRGAATRAVGSNEDVAKVENQHMQDGVDPRA